MSDTRLSKDRASIILNIVCFLGTGIITLYLGMAMLAWWGLVILVGSGVVLWGKSRRAKGAALSALACIGCFLVAGALWPLFRVIAPKYFDEDYDPKAGKVIRRWQQNNWP